jgi:hypothetical protein
MGGRLVAQQRSPISKQRRAELEAAIASFISPVSRKPKLKTDGRAALPRRLLNGLAAPRSKPISVLQAMKADEAAS